MPAERTSQRNASDPGYIEFNGACESRGREVRVTHCLGHHEVDASTEDALKVFLEAEVGVERIRCTRGEVDEDVHIAVLRSETVAGCRTRTSEGAARRAGATHERSLHGRKPRQNS
jgi:hypothetical protein